MDTDSQLDYEILATSLANGEWRVVLAAVPAAADWIKIAPLGDSRIDRVVSTLVDLASHSKWEVRRAVANAAAYINHPSFAPVLSRLIRDDNARVKQAAEQAALRRRDWRNASALGKQHEEHINATLDEIESRFGVRGRDAVKRASEQIANTFARELYHEVIKLMSPLAMSVDRLRTQMMNDACPREELALEAERINRRITQLRAVMDAMRAFTEQQKLFFAPVELADVVNEAASLAAEGHADGLGLTIEVRVPPNIIIEVAPGRVVQALTNVLVNAIEAYDGSDVRKPIVVSVKAEQGRVELTIEDFGCGMSPEAAVDAACLFATSKVNGTGFGLPLAIKIIESEHNGRLLVESTKGQGTRVSVILPIHRQELA